MDSYENKMDITSGDCLPDLPIREIDTSSIQKQMSKNKELLQVKLMVRRPISQLVEQGILPPPKQSPISYEQTRKLERARTEDYLRHKIGNRPNRQQLIEHHILADSNVSPMLVAKQQQLKKARLADDLNERLSHRPGPLELIKGDILLTGSAQLQEAVKKGAIAFKPTSAGETIKHPTPSFLLFRKENASSVSSSSPIMRCPHHVITPTQMGNSSVVAPSIGTGCACSMHLQHFGQSPLYRPVTMARSQVSSADTFLLDCDEDAEENEDSNQTSSSCSSSSVDSTPMSIEQSPPNDTFGENRDLISFVHPPEAHKLTAAVGSLMGAANIFARSSPCDISSPASSFGSSNGFGGSTATVEVMGLPINSPGRLATSIHKLQKKKTKAKIPTKSKTIKFHEYKGPPNTARQQNQVLNSCAQPRTETAYELLLQQQQLYLQLELEMQQQHKSSSQKRGSISLQGTVKMDQNGNKGSLTNKPNTLSITNPIKNPTLAMHSSGASVARSSLTLPFVSTIASVSSHLEHQTTSTASSVHATQSVRQMTSTENSSHPSASTSPSRVSNNSTSEQTPNQITNPYQSECATSSTETSAPISTNISIQKLEEMKVNDLKTQLKLHNLPVSGPKPMLIQRLKNYIAKTRQTNLTKNAQKINDPSENAMEVDTSEYSSSSQPNSQLTPTIAAQCSSAPILSNFVNTGFTQIFQANANSLIGMPTRSATFSSGCSPSINNGRMHPPLLVKKQGMIIAGNPIGYEGASKQRRTSEPQLQHIQLHIAPNPLLQFSPTTIAGQPTQLTTANTQQQIHFLSSPTLNTSDLQLIPTQPMGLANWTIQPTAFPQLLLYSQSTPTAQPMSMRVPAPTFGVTLNPNPVVNCPLTVPSVQPINTSEQNSGSGELPKTSNTSQNMSSTSSSPSSLFIKNSIRKTIQNKQSQKQKSKSNNLRSPEQMKVERCAEPVDSRVSSTSLPEKVSPKIEKPANDYKPSSIQQTDTELNIQTESNSTFDQCTMNSYASCNYMPFDQSSYTHNGIMNRPPPNYEEAIRQTQPKYERKVSEFITMPIDNLSHNNQVAALNTTNSSCTTNNTNTTENRNELSFDLDWLMDVPELMDFNTDAVSRSSSCEFNEFLKQLGESANSSESTFPKPVENSNESNTTYGNTLNERRAHEISHSMQMDYQAAQNTDLFTGLVNQESSSDMLFELVDVSGEVNSKFNWDRTDFTPVL